MKKKFIIKFVPTSIIIIKGNMIIKSIIFYINVPKVKNNVNIKPCLYKKVFLIILLFIRNISFN